MPAPIALQLYTVRDLLKDDYEGTIRQLADKGFVGIEPAGFPGTTLEDAVKLIADLGLRVPSAHLPLPVGETRSQALETAEALGCKYVVSGFGPDRFDTLDNLKATCEAFNQAGANAAEAGFVFGIHNHWWEYVELEGRRVYEYMLEFIEPNVVFEVDTYWVQTGGCDPARIVAEMGVRAPILHIKDGPCVKEQSMTAVGQGKVDVPAIVDAGGAITEWMIVELDRCDGDMLEAVMQSYDYLVSEGLARGNR